MWRRRSRRGAAALVALVLSAGAGTAYAAWTATTGPPAATFSGAPDWSPPAVTATGIQKAGTNPGYSAGYVRPGGQYYVYARVTADTGSPASGILTPGGITANLAGLTTGQPSAALTSGSYTSQSASYNYRVGPFTVSAAAGSQPYTVSARDVAGNSVTTPTQSVVVDGTAPTGADAQGVAVGGTPGKAETGDKLVLSFSEPIDPSSVILGWDGSSRNVAVRIVNGSKADTIEVWNGSSTIAPLGTITLPGKDYVKSSVDFTASPMALSGSTLTVTLGTTSGASNVTTGSSGPIGWVPTSSLYDRAGNALSSSTVTGSGDAEF